MKVSLRSATDRDLELMMAWRSSPLVFQGFYTQRQPLEWDEHVGWWFSRNKDWRTFIIEYAGRDVGTVTIGNLDHWCPELGVMIGETTLWGRGIGTAAIEEAIKWLREYAISYPYIVACRTTIKDSNIASKKLFLKCDFKWMAVARSGESWYNRTLEVRDVVIQGNQRGN